MTTHRSLEINCPGCGAPAHTSDKDCKFCGRPVIISTFTSVASMSMPELNKYASVYKQALSSTPDDQSLNASIGMCYLKLKLYDKALLSFEKAIEVDFDNSENYFYAALCLLEGKKAFLATRSNITRVLEFIDAAIQIEARGIFYYFMAYVKYDFFERKSLNISPGYIDDMKTAQGNNVTTYDIVTLFNILNVPIPNELAITNE